MDEDDAEWVVYQGKGSSEAYQARQSDWDAHMDRVQKYGGQSSLTLLARGLTQEQAFGIVKLLDGETE